MDLRWAEERVGGVKQADGINTTYRYRTHPAILANIPLKTDNVPSSSSSRRQDDERPAAGCRMLSLRRASQTASSSATSNIRRMVIEKDARPFDSDTLGLQLVDGEQPVGAGGNASVTSNRRLSFGGVFVARVAQRSLAEESGLRPGDQLLAINGVPLVAGGGRTDSAGASAQLLSGVLVDAGQAMSMLERLSGQLRLLVQPAADCGHQQWHHNNNNNNNDDDNRNGATADDQSLSLASKWPSQISAENMLDRRQWRRRQHHHRHQSWISELEEPAARRSTPSAGGTAAADETTSPQSPSSSLPAAAEAKVRTGKGLPINSRATELAAKLDALVEEHLPDEVDKINLSYYINEFETNSCDLSELLTNLLQNLLMKLPNPMIKYKLLSYIKQLYIEPAAITKSAAREGEEEEDDGNGDEEGAAERKQQDTWPWVASWPVVGQTAAPIGATNRTRGTKSGASLSSPSSLSSSSSSSMLLRQNSLVGGETSATITNSNKHQLDLRLFEAMTRRYLVASNVLMLDSVLSAADGSQWPSPRPRSSLATAEQRKRRRQRRAAELQLGYQQQQQQQQQQQHHRHNHRPRCLAAERAPIRETDDCEAPGCCVSESRNLSGQAGECRRSVGLSSSVGAAAAATAFAPGERRRCQDEGGRQQRSPRSSSSIDYHSESSIEYTLDKRRKNTSAADANRNQSPASQEPIAHQRQQQHHHRPPVEPTNGTTTQQLYQPPRRRHRQPIGVLLPSSSAAAAGAPPPPLPTRRPGAADAQLATAAAATAARTSRPLMDSPQQRGASSGDLNYYNAGRQSGSSNRSICIGGLGGQRSLVRARSTSLDSLNHLTTTTAAAAATSTAARLPLGPIHQAARPYSGRRLPDNVYTLFHRNFDHHNAAAALSTLSSGGGAHSSPDYLVPLHNGCGGVTAHDRLGYLVAAPDENCRSPPPFPPLLSDESRWTAPGSPPRRRMSSATFYQDLATPFATTTDRRLLVASEEPLAIGRPYSSGRLPPDATRWASSEFDLSQSWRPEPFRRLGGSFMGTNPFTATTADERVFQLGPQFTDSRQQQHYYSEHYPAPPWQRTTKAELSLANNNTTNTINNKGLANDRAGVSHQQEHEDTATSVTTTTTTMCQTTVLPPEPLLPAGAEPLSAAAGPHAYASLEAKTIPPSVAYLPMGQHQQQQQQQRPNPSGASFNVRSGGGFHSIAVMQGATMDASPCQYSTTTVCESPSQLIKAGDTLDDAFARPPPPPMGAAVPRGPSAKSCGLCRAPPPDPTRDPFRAGSHIDLRGAASAASIECWPPPSSTMGAGMNAQWTTCENEPPPPPTTAAAAAATRALCCRDRCCSSMSVPCRSEPLLPPPRPFRAAAAANHYHHHQPEQSNATVGEPICCGGLAEPGGGATMQQQQQHGAVAAAAARRQQPSNIYYPQLNNNNNYMNYMDLPTTSSLPSSPIAHDKFAPSAAGQPQQHQRHFSRAHHQAAIGASHRSRHHRRHRLSSTAIATSPHQNNQPSHYHQHQHPQPAARHSRHQRHHSSSIQLKDYPASGRAAAGEGEQEEEEEEEEEELSDSAISLSLVPVQAKGRLPLSVAEQMKEQASNFVNQQGKRSSGGHRQKPNLQVRRTLRVKIKKSKPILGIAIEGGFNVSGQLLPRIVCVHEDGAAYQCGKLRASDLILEVNGTPTVNMTHDEIAKTIATAYYQDPRSYIEFLIGESVHV